MMRLSSTVISQRRVEKPDFSVAANCRRKLMTCMEQAEVDTRTSSYNPSSFSMGFLPQMRTSLRLT